MALPEEGSRQALQEQKFGFAAFANGSIEYRRINTAFIDLNFPLVDGQNILDIACGTGHVTGIISEKYHAEGIKGTVIGIDPNRASIERAKIHVPSSDLVPVTFIHDYGQNLLDHVDTESIDIAVIANGIHEIPGDDTKMAVLSAIYAALKPGGRLIVNSAFTKESEVDIMKWGMWNKLAWKQLGAKEDKSIPVENGFEVHSKHKYIEMMTEAGLVVVSNHGEEDEDGRIGGLTKSDLALFARYDKFIEGEWPSNVIIPPIEGVDLTDPIQRMQVQSDALVAALDPLEELVRRREHDESAQLVLKLKWVEFSAQKPPLSNTVEAAS